MKTRLNTKKHRPHGEEWLHFLRQRSQLPDAPGRWYANIERESTRGQSAHQFLVWIEERLRTYADRLKARPEVEDAVGAVPEGVEAALEGAGVAAPAEP